MTSARSKRIYSVGALLLAAALAGCGPSESTATKPAGTNAARGSASSTSDFPAFQGGGALTGVAQDVTSPPLKLRWKVTSKTSYEGGPVIAGECVYLAGSDGTLQALDLQDGKRRWQYKGEQSFGVTPLVDSGLVVVGDTAGTVHAVDAADGRKRWTFDAKTRVYASANKCAQGYLVPTESGAVPCISPEGKEVWSGQADDRINSAPAVAGNRAYIGGCDRIVRALSTADGREVAANSIGDVTSGSPAVDGDRVIVGLYKSVIACLSADKLETVWTYTEIADEAPVKATPAVDRGVVVVGAGDSCVHGLDRKTGKRRWLFRARDAVDASAVISGGTVYVGGTDKQFYALDLQTGKSVYEYQAEGAISAAAAVARGVVVFVDANGTVYCLEPAK